jgi:hypothetical protein
MKRTQNSLFNELKQNSKEMIYYRLHNIKSSFVKSSFFLTFFIIIYYLWIFENDSLAAIYTDTYEETYGDIIEGEMITIDSKCSCRPLIKIYRNALKETIRVQRQLAKDYIIYYGKNNNTNNSFLNNPRMKCDLYSTLRHGPKSKVISYSLFSDNYAYYKNIERTVMKAKILYPDWNIRINYDKSINRTIICDLECKYNTIDFCDMNNVPSMKNLLGYINLMSGDEKNPQVINHVIRGTDMTGVHAMMWRWFLAGDDFVDYFSSRNLDSELIEREKDSVDVWLKENTEFHIMRDNPSHNTFMLGGISI